MSTNPVPATGLYRQMKVVLNLGIEVELMISNFSGYLSLPFLGFSSFSPHSTLSFVGRVSKMYTTYSPFSKV